MKDDWTLLLDRFLTDVDFRKALYEGDLTTFHLLLINAIEYLIPDMKGQRK